jgi:copper chaperone CopZ
VRVEVAGLAGVNRAAYDPARDLFTVDYDSDRVSLEAVFAAVFLAGKKMGQDYLPRLVTATPTSK